jgi:hypothetical protein
MKQETSMTTPIDPLVAEMLELLDDDLREAFEERAGIFEFDAGLPRAHSECLALLSVLQRNPAALTGVLALWVKVGKTYAWLVTTDIDRARKYVAAKAGEDLTVVDLGFVLNENFSGLACLNAVASTPPCLTAQD